MGSVKHQLNPTKFEKLANWHDILMKDEIIAVNFSEALKLIKEKRFYRPLLDS